MFYLSSLGAHGFNIAEKGRGGVRPHESVLKFRMGVEGSEGGRTAKKTIQHCFSGGREAACAIIETQEVKFRVGVDRSKGIAQDFNRRYDVESLCRGFPKRVQLLVEG